METSTPPGLTVSAARDAMEAPWAASGSALVRVRFQTVTRWPLASRFAAIGNPMAPRPTNPISRLMPAPYHAHPKFLDSGSFARFARARLSGSHHSEAGAARLDRASRAPRRGRVTQG